MSTLDLVHAPLVDVSALIAGGQASSLEITDALLARIEQTEPTVNAYIDVLADSARRAARAADAVLASGHRLGPLHGVPVSVKDIFDVAGTVNTGGGRLAGSRTATADAPAVARLRAAGAVIVGKTNLHEYAYGYTTENPHYGPTRNPWDPTRMAGGSSGGSAAAVACGSAILALGTDTGGSIRVPSSFCGTVGIKPTYGRVSRRGVLPLAWSLDHAGPIGRTVRDVALALEVMAGYDPQDPASADRAVPAMAGEREYDLAGVRVGVPSNHFFDGIQPTVLSAVRAAIDALSELGATLVEVTIPAVEHTVSAWLAILLAEAAAAHERDLWARPDLYGADVRLYLEQGALVPAVTYLRAQRVRGEIVAAFRRAMVGVDVLATPATAMTAPQLGTVELELGEESEELFHALARISAPFDVTGLPAISLPCGADEHGLPIGLQLVGHAFDEPMILRVADAYEQRGDWHGRHPD